MEGKEVLLCMKLPASGAEPSAGSYRYRGHAKVSLSKGTRASMHIVKLKICLFTQVRVYK